MAPGNETAPPLAGSAEKGLEIHSARSPDALRDGNDNGGDHCDPETDDRSSGTGRINLYIRAFERQLVVYNLEARGIARVREDERMKRLSWISYLQACLLWVSINLAPNNITLGMLGPAVYGLSFLDASLCAVFGALLGSLVASWLATWGPVSGLRTMVIGRYAMGWWPSKIVVILNLIQMIGYSLIDCVVGGQILSAVSPNGSMSVAVGMLTDIADDGLMLTSVGIVIVAIISWVVATFGIRVFHYYER
ncbi:Nucleoside transporter [Aspergillus sclerotialis]|uniref:Nucleoside transporter n=1 Tax=Aspergillus sclerotialis TaxID=2070753 RepID=A0A3A2ZAW9_9EURO|nr:Nucleoside transporter [Aspergillus sclerotialis]